MLTHVPLCLNCVTREVAGKFSYPDGSGFCSAICEAEAQAEFAAYTDGVAFEGFPAIVIEQEATEQFDRDLRDDEAALESAYGPSDDMYSDFDGYECPEFDY